MDIDSSTTTLFDLYSCGSWPSVLIDYLQKNIQKTTKILKTIFQNITITKTSSCICNFAFHFN